MSTDDLILSFRFGRNELKPGMIGVYLGEETSAVHEMEPLDPRPLVSVVIPAFNGEKTIELTLASLAEQTYPRMEWLVIDDGSQDGTSGAVSKFLAAHPSRGRLIRHEENWGIARTLNHGLRESKGDAILFVHQDIVLLSREWITRAVEDLRASSSIKVVTADYGIPDSQEVDFVQRVFGIMRRQFHAGPDEGKEYVTFTEFKCDLTWSGALREIGGFPERFRAAGEDLWVCYLLRSRGGQLVKDYGLKCVQRFGGDATSLSGNLRKEFRFGQAIAGPLIKFRSYPAQGLRGTPYSRSRAWNRASQPFFLLAVLMLLLFGALTKNWWFVYALVGLLIGRLTYYGWRLFPDLRALLRSRSRALAEAIAGAGFGILSDLAYSSGLAVGIARWTAGSQV